MAGVTKEKQQQIEAQRENVKKLASIGCTYEEIALITGMARATVIRKFSDEFAAGQADLKMSLRRMQLDAAKKGDVSMLRHLGKHYLGQKDTTDINVTQSDNRLEDVNDDELVELMIASNGKVKPITDGKG